MKVISEFIDWLVVDIFPKIPSWILLGSLIVFFIVSATAEPRTFNEDWKITLSYQAR